MLGMAVAERTTNSQLLPRLQTIKRGKADISKHSEWVNVGRSAHARTFSDYFDPPEVEGQFCKAICVGTDCIVPYG